MRILKILKYSFLALMLGFLIFIFCRIMMTEDRSALNSLHPTEAAREAYAADGDGAFLCGTIPNEVSRDGYFTAYALTYAPASDELQLTVRYNDRLCEKYLKGADPESFYFVIKTKDGKTVSTARVVDERERYHYNHLRLSFEGIEGGSSEELYLFLCCDSASYPAAHTKGILVLHPALTLSEYKLSKDEKSALE